MIRYCHVIAGNVLLREGFPPSSKGKEFAFFIGGVPVQLTARGLLEQGHGLVYQQELLHGGDGWLHIVCKAYYSISFLYRRRWRSKEEAWAMDRTGGNQDSFESPLKEG